MASGMETRPRRARRARAVAGAVALGWLLAAAGLVTPSSAQDPTTTTAPTTTGPTTTVPTTTPPSTGAGSSSTTESDTPPTTDPGSTGTPPSSDPTSTPGSSPEPPPGPQPDGGGEGDDDGVPTDELPVDDPLSGEGPGEEAPDLDPEIPPPDTYGGQEPYRPPEILWSSVAEAERKLDRSREDKREAVAGVRALRLRAKHLALERAALDEETTAAVEELSAALERYRTRAVADYRRFGTGGSTQASAVIDPTDLRQAIERQRSARLAEAAVGVGGDDLDRLDELRRGLDGDARALLDRSTAVADYLVEAEAAVAEVDERIEQATIEYEAFRAGSEIFIDGVLFPIAGPYNVPLIDSFGFPRMTGTADEHWHEGIDIFAPRGTPLVAAERGVVTRVGIGRLGGLKLWLVGESGSEWYYAHLDSFAPGLADGLLVEAGDLLGYVGNTGNAVGTPPHLHLQLHPDGGRPVNPYPLLAMVSDLDQAALADGTHAGWRHESVVVNGPPAALDADG